MTRIQAKWLLAPDKKEDDPPQRMEATRFQIRMFGQLNAIFCFAWTEENGILKQWSCKQSE
jgi:hypothetical protein